MKQQLTINKLPVPTWRFLKGNEVNLDWEIDDTNSMVQIIKNENMFSITATTNYGDAEMNFNTKENENLTFLQIIGGDENINQEPQNLKLNTKLTLAKSSKLKLIQVFVPEIATKIINNVESTCADQATVEIIQFALGKGDTYNEVITNLDGKSSKLFLDIGYITKNQTLDMNILAKHKASQSQSEIFVEGVIGDNGKKVFRGTIDLQNGASEAVGSEEENVLLLGDDFQNLTIPVILCGQEDVRGAHGGAIGELTDDVVFYLKSRGIDKKTAEILMSYAKMKRVLDKIQDENIETIVNKLIQEKLEYEQ